MDCEWDWRTKLLLATEQGLLMLLIVVILLVGIPSYVDVGGAVQIAYYILAALLAIGFLLLVCLIVLDSMKHLKTLKKKRMLPVLLLLVVFGIPLIFSWMAIQDHKSSWRLLSQAWTAMSDLNQTDSLSLWQVKGNCCGFMGPYDYIQKGLDLPENCFYYVDSEQKVKDGCYKVFRDEAFTLHVIIVGIFAVYLIVKILLDFLAGKADRNVGNRNGVGKRKSSDIPVSYSFVYDQQIND